MEEKSNASERADEWVTSKKSVSEKNYIVPDEERRKIKIAFTGMIICVIVFCIIAVSGNMRNSLPSLILLIGMISATPILLFLLLKKFRFF